MKRFYKNNGKRFWFTLIISFVSMMSFATTYYVSSSTGNDANNGTSSSTPWKTLSKVNATAFTSGDQILFKAGDTFYGALTSSNSVQGWDKVLTYGSFGTGSKPVISGFETISGWVSQGNGIYSATTSVTSSCNMVSVNGVNTPIGRYPKSGYLTFETFSGSTSITDSQLAATPVWTGSEVVIQKNGFQYDRGKITNHTSHTITYSGGSGTPDGLGGYKYYIQGGLSALTQVGDWWISGNTIYMYFGTNAPTNYIVNVSKISILAAISKNNVKFDGLRFEGANDKGVESVGTGNSIKNCEFEFMGHYAITCAQSNVTLDNNTIKNGNGSAIFMNANNYVISNNRISNYGLFPGMVTNGTNNYNGIDIIANAGGTCEYNSISNVGYLGINTWGSNNIIRFNKIDGFCSLLPDGGGIYANYIGTSYPTGIKIYNNIVLNGGGEGLYSDAVNQNTEWYNNVVINCVSGLLINTPVNHNVHDNIFYNNVYGLNLYNWHTNSLIPQGCNVVSNVIVEGSKSSLAEKIGDSSNRDILKIGVVDNNKIYSETTKQSALFKAFFSPTAPLSNYDLTNWRSLTGFEKNATYKSIVLTDISVLYNDTKVAKTVSLSGSYVDSKGVKYTNSITLQPYSSAFLIKDNTPTTVTFTEYKSICDGSTYNGWTVAGTYERTLVAKSGADSIVTTHLTVNPKYSISESISINEGENYNGWTTSGTYTRKLSSVNGCDSTITTNLTVATAILKQGDLAPTHFKPIWLGQNGLNHMNLVVVSALIENVSLSTDDEIAVFSKSLCVGAGRLSSSISSSDNTTYLTIRASQNDGTNNGFTDNDTIIFKIWDSQNQKELTVNKVTYKSDVTTWKTNGKFAASSTAVAEIENYKVYTQNIELQKGYNMVSTYLTAQDPNVTSLTKPLIDEGNLIKLQDETGNSLENWGDFGGWINKVGSIEETEGYKIQVANNCTLQVTGRPIAMPLDVYLKAGWNIISFPKTELVNAMTVVQSLIDQNKLIKVQDEAGNSIENWGLFGGWKNGIGNFIPGKAYKVKMSSDATLTFQESYTKSVLVTINTVSTEHFTPAYEGNGTDHMNLNISGLNNSQISIGDELAAFDGNICVGAVKITNDDLLTNTVSLVTSYTTDDKVQNGFKVGDQIQIVTWNKETDNEANVVLEIVSGQTKFEKNATSFVSLKSIATSTTSSSLIDNLNDEVKIDVYPNPCQGKFNVRFSELPQENSKVEVTDISGRKVISRIISDTLEEFQLNNFTAGIYFVKSVIGSKEYVHKLIVNK